MAVTPTVVTVRQLAAQYTGSNGAELAAWLGGTLTSEADGHALIVPAQSFPITLATGDWVIAYGTTSGAIYNTRCTQAEYDAGYVPVPPVGA